MKLHIVPPDSLSHTQPVNLKEEVKSLNGIHSLAEAQNGAFLFKREMGSYSK